MRAVARTLRGTIPPPGDGVRRSRPDAVTVKPADVCGCCGRPLPCEWHPPGWTPAHEAYCKMRDAMKDVAALSAGERAKYESMMGRFEEVPLTLGREE